MHTSSQAIYLSWIRNVKVIVGCDSGISVHFSFTSDPRERPLLRVHSAVRLGFSPYEFHLRKGAKSHRGEPFKFANTSYLKTSDFRLYTNGICIGPAGLGCVRFFQMRKYRLNPCMLGGFHSRFLLLLFPPSTSVCFVVSQSCSCHFPY